MMRWLKSSLPKIVPTPRAEWVKYREMNAANISGDDAAAAIKVAPATSSGILYLTQNCTEKESERENGEGIVKLYVCSEA